MARQLDPEGVHLAALRRLAEFTGARWADAATRAVDARIAAGDLVEEAVDDHEVCKHYADGADLVEDVAGSKRRLPEQAVPMLQAIDRPLVVRDRCRLRRLRVC